MGEYNALAIDFGASSGRAIIGTYKEGKIQLKEIHRFLNEPVKLNDTLYWDFLRLFLEVKNSLIKSKKYCKIDSIAINTWGVDFGILDKSGNLIDNPVHYRDERTQNILEEVFKIVDKNTIYKKTGNQIMNINTLFQLYALKQKNNEIFKLIDKVLLMPDLFNYFLTNKKVTDMSIASTTQLLNQNEKYWDNDILSKLDFDENIFTDIVKSGTILSPIKKELQEELNIHSVDVISVAGHDTQDAILSTPTIKEDFIFLSCGTWSLMGTELKEPIINNTSIKYNFTNEIGYNNTTNFLKNIVGLWIIQESKRRWEKEGYNYSFSELENLALQEESFKAFIDVDDDVFMSVCDMPKTIKDYCLKKQNVVLSEIGQIVRVINESLAFKYRKTLDELSKCTNKNYESIYIIGGGVQSKMLCQMTANACNCTVYAGPVEATVFGNICIQLMASNKICGIKEAREVIRNSEQIKVYKPENIDAWEQNYKKFKKMFSLEEVF